MQTPSVQGARYFITLQDVHTGYQVAYFIKQKTDVLDQNKIWVAQWRCYTLMGAVNI